MLRDVLWKVATHAAAWGLMLLGSLALLTWGHRLGAALFSALLIGTGVLIGALAQLSPPVAPRKRANNRPARPEA